MNDNKLMNRAADNTTCIDECPVGAISEGEKYVINADACTECGTCADVCPSGAISL